MCACHAKNLNEPIMHNSFVISYYFKFLIIFIFTAKYDWQKNIYY
jgi:hypothetical protein